ncbi:hypothetical protein [Novosphingobium sp. 1748]|uniref:hypothetical protein n=1 Tax=Novosphingobium sp. 1748 TaxID=2817760 RepID=UPI00286ADEC1|nr:hypothetical protein [Novosphingobium sp. 1748]
MKSWADLLVPSAAATVIGLMQVAVYKRQAKIATHGNDVNLFKERLPVYQACENLMFEAIEKKGQISTAIQDDYLRKRKMAGFLFPEEMVKIINDIYSVVVTYGDRQRRFESGLVTGMLPDELLKDLAESEAAVVAAFHALPTQFSLMKISQDPLTPVVKSSPPTDES